MYHMQIISHRGAAGIEPENTILGIEAAVKEDVDGIEFDVRVTKDNKLVVSHDANLYRITGKNKNVQDMTLHEISLVSTHSGHPIPAFDEAMEAAGNIPVLIDCKGKGWAKIVAKELERHKNKQVSVTATDHKEMYNFVQLRPDVETYVSELSHAFDAIKKADLMGFTGISLNFWAINPMAYVYAKRKRKKILIFTVNRFGLARFLHGLYPKAAVITDFPHRLSKLSKRRRGK